MGRRTALLIAAVLIAAAGAALILMYVQGINARAVEGQDRVAVLAATETITAGETVADAQKAGKLDSVEVARADLVEGALSSTDSIAEQVALGDVYPGEQIIAQKFGAVGSQESLTIPDDQIAISVNLDDPARVAGFVNPGSEVAIFVNAESGRDETAGPITALLLPKVQVVGVGQTTVQSTTKTTPEGEQTVEQIPRTILTLAVSQDDAEKVIYASKNHSLTFALRNDKSKITAGPGVTADDILPEASR
ncbi:MAG: Flp pilus assembly protein CpaB [Nocardioidaceae bacterium]